MLKTKHQVNIQMTRRTVLTSGAAAFMALSLSKFAHATSADVDALVAKIANGQTPQSGRIDLSMPQIAENGNVVPLSVSVESPMSDTDYVKSVHLFADGNPSPEVASFHFTPMSGLAKASSRMRMAKTQNVVALAEMSDGSVYMESVLVKVTIGGCGG